MKDARPYITAYDALTLEQQCEIVHVWPAMTPAAPAPDACPGTGRKPTRLPRFSPSRHLTPAPPEQLARWRGHLATLAATPAQERAAAGERASLYALIRGSFYDRASRHPAPGQPLARCGQDADPALLALVGQAVQDYLTSTGEPPGEPDLIL